MNHRCPDGRPRHARAPRRNPSPKMRGGKIRHHGFSRRKNNKCRNPSHACKPRRNPSPPLRPVTAAFAHLLTDQHPIWSVLKVIYVSCNYGFITCLAQTLVLPEICLLPAQDACRNIITICTPTQKNWGFGFFLLQPLLSDKCRCIGQNSCFSSALLAFKGRIAHLMANP